jgi:hypothetical protein
MASSSPMASTLLREFRVAAHITNANLTGGRVGETGGLYAAARMEIEGVLTAIMFGTWHRHSQPITSRIWGQIEFPDPFEPVTHIKKPEADRYIGTIQLAAQNGTDMDAKESPLNPNEPPKGLIQGWVKVSLPIAMYPTIYAMKNEMIHLDFAFDPVEAGDKRTTLPDCAAFVRSMSFQTFVETGVVGDSCR